MPPPWRLHYKDAKERNMIHLKINDVIELSIAKMLRHGVPQLEAKIAAPIYLEGEL